MHDRARSYVLENPKTTARLICQLSAIVLTLFLAAIIRRSRLSFINATTKFTFGTNTGVCTPNAAANVGADSKTAAAIKSKCIRNLLAVMLTTASERKRCEGLDRTT